MSNSRKANTKLFQKNPSAFISACSFWKVQITVLWPNRLVSSDSHLTSCHSPPTSCQILASDAFWHHSQVPPLLHLAAPGKTTSKLSAGHRHHRSDDLPEQCFVSWRSNHEVPSWRQCSCLPAGEFKDCLIHLNRNHPLLIQSNFSFQVCPMALGYN